MRLCKALHMHFADYCVAPRHLRGVVVGPVERLVDHDALQSRRAIVDATRRVLRIRHDPHVFRCIGRAVDRPRIRIEQQFVRIESHRVLRDPWAVCSVAIECAGTGVAHCDVPEVVFTTLQAHASGLASSVLRIVEAKINGGRMP